MNYVDKIKDYLEQELEAIKSLDLEMVSQVMNVLENARLNGRRIYICGNGGSGSTASHFCCDFNKVCDNKDEKYSIECLNDNVPTILAVSNDYGYDEVFARQAEAHVRPGDLFIGISTSGNSENVFRAVNVAKEKGAITAAFLGKDGGRIKGIVDYPVVVECDTTARVQESHICIIHIICELVEKAMAK